MYCFSKPVVLIYTSNQKQNMHKVMIHVPMRKIPNNDKYEDEDHEYV